MDGTNLFISNFEMKDAGRLGRRFLVFLPLLLLVIAVNICLDPAGLYRKPVDRYHSEEFRIAQALAAGRDMTVRRPIDDRLLQKYFIEGSLTAPDLIVLGSSHSAWLGNYIFAHHRVMNHSVTTAVLADYLGIYDAYAKKDLLPQQVILVLDPQLIILPLSSEKWLSIKDNVNDMLGRLGIHSAIIQQPFIPQSWLNILSFSYFQQAVKKIGIWKNGQDAIDVDLSNRRTFYSDGKSSWDEEIFLLDQQKNNRINVQGPVGNEELLKQLKPDRELKYILETFIKYLIKCPTHVILCMLPLSPQLYKYLHDQHQGSGTLDITDIERYYRDLAKRFNIEIVGSYDPSACGLDSKDFYDGDHVRNDVIERILTQKGSQCCLIR